MNIIVVSSISKSGNFTTGNTVQANGAAQLIDSGHAEKFNNLAVRIALGA